MNVKRWLWGLWAAMIVSMLLRQTLDTYMVVALIIIPILIVLLDLHDEIADLKDENKHLRKFVVDRYNALQEKVNDAFNQIEKRMVVDFAEMSKNEEENVSYQGHGGYVPPERRKPRVIKKRSNANPSSSNNPFDDAYKTEDEKFAEEKFGKGSASKVDDVVEGDEPFDQDSYDEKVLDQSDETFDFEEEQEIMEGMPKIEYEPDNRKF